MANQIRIKRTGTASSSPTTSDLTTGELAINYADGKLFALKDDGTQSVITIGEDLDGTGFADRIRDIVGITDTFEPTGFPNRTDTTISFNNTNRTFTISPTGSEFSVWCKGKKYTKTSAQSVQIGTATGLYYIYFDNTGNIGQQTSYFDWENHAPTAYVYWNATTSTAIYFADERHGVALDWATHEYLHRTRGAVIANGFSISNFTTTGDGSADAHAQIDISGGTFFDEDLQVDIVDTNTPTANTWQQDLSGPAQIPVLYINGSAWEITTANNFPVKQGTARPQYNLLSGSTWSTPDVSSGKFFNYFICATHNLNYPVVSVMGQGEFSNIGQAEEEEFTDLALTGFPSVEFRPLYRLTFSTDNYTNTPNAALESVYDIRWLQTGGIAMPVNQGGTSDHGLLNGLGDDDHSQYLHTTTSRTGVTANLGTSGTISTTNATASTSTTTGALTVAGGAGIAGNVYIGGSLDLGTALGVGEGGTGLTGTPANGQLLIGNGSGFALATLTEGTNVTITESAGAIEIASNDTTYTAGDGLDLSVGNEFSLDLKANSGLVIDTTELSLDLGASAITGTLAIGDGGTGQSTTPTDGQLLIGNTSTSGFDLTTLTAGTNITITEGNGTITISSADTDTTYTAGDGLDLSVGNEFSLDLKANSGLVIDTTELSIDLSASAISGTLGVSDGGTGFSTAAKGSVIIANTADTLSALDGGGVTSGLLKYDHSTDTIAWDDVANYVDNGFTHTNINSSPHDTTPLSQLQAKGTDSTGSAAANVSFVLEPKGNGAIYRKDPVAALLPKGGIGSTCWQMTLNSASATLGATGAYSTVSGGLGNLVNGTYGTIAGGNTNTAYSVAFVGGGQVNDAGGTWSAICGGSNNISDGSRSFVGGGNSNEVTSAGAYSVCCGGSSNSVSNDYSYLGGGSLNTVSGRFSVLSGGTQNTASNNLSTVLGGSANTASGIYSLAWGYSTTASGRFSVSLGDSSSSTHDGAFAIGNQATCNTKGQIALKSHGLSTGATSYTGGGFSLLSFGVETTDATPTVLTSDLATASTDNQLALTTDEVVIFKLTCIAKSGSTDFKGWIITGMAREGSGSIFIVGSLSETIVAETSGASSWDVSVTADSTNDCLAVTVTGAAATTIKWSANFETTHL